MSVFSYGFVKDKTDTKTLTTENTKSLLFLTFSSAAQPKMLLTEIFIPHWKFRLNPSYKKDTAV